MRSIRLKNFRSFEDTGRIELKPITILVGANSSGKSSFLRFFPLLRQTVEAMTRARCSGMRTRVTWISADFGRRREEAHSRRKIELDRRDRRPRFPDADGAKLCNVRRESNRRWGRTQFARVP